VLPTSATLLGIQVIAQNGFEPIAELAAESGWRW
jgi:hypothetical protein